jgi:hypothetical protein
MGGDKDIPKCPEPMKIPEAAAKTYHRRWTQINADKQ